MMKALVKLRLCCLALLFFIPAGVYAATVQVSARNFSFNPATVTINVGDTVTWTFSGGPHTTTSGTSCVADGLWDSGSKASGTTFSHVFNQAGTFPYFCIPHCLSGMTGTVIVNQAASEKIEFSVTPGCGGVGTPVNIAAESSLGGKFYKYWVNTVPWCQPGTANWQVIQDWSTAKTAPWVPGEAGIHTVVVWVSNVASDQACEHGQIGATYDVGGSSCTDPVQVTLNPSSGAVNQPVTVRAEASGADLRYKFWVNTVDFCNTGQSANWLVVQDWSTADTATFVPSAPGIYTLIAWALPPTDLNNPCPPQGGMVYDVPDGPVLYGQNCAGCHGQLATSNVRGASAASTQSAINSNAGGMGTLTFLTPVQVQSIAAALAP